MAKVLRRLPYNVRAVKAGADNDDCRPALKKIRIDRNTATTADGFVLIQYVMPKEFVCDEQTDPVLVDAKLLAGFVKSDFELEAEDNKVTLRQAIPGGNQSMELAIDPNLKFPGYDKILGKIEDTDKAFYIDAKYLEMVAKVVKSAGFRYIRVQPGKDANCPVRFDAYTSGVDDRITIIVMPMHYGNEKTLKRIMAEQ